MMRFLILTRQTGVPAIDLTSNRKAHDAVILPPCLVETHVIADYIALDTELISIKKFDNERGRVGNVFFDVQPHTFARPRGPVSARPFTAGHMLIDAPCVSPT